MPYQGARDLRLAWGEQGFVEDQSDDDLAAGSYGPYRPDAVILPSGTPDSRRLYDWVKSVDAT